MSNEPEPGMPQAVRIYAVVLGVGVCCSLAIVTTYEWTRPIIQRNKTLQRQSAIFSVLAEATTLQAYCFDAGRGRFESVSPEDIATDAANEGLVFAGFDQKGDLAGLAIEAKGIGYQDTIRLLYAYSFDQQAIVGIRVLESRETPGLGDRIETDEKFLQSFDRLDVALDSTGNELAHPIQFVNSGNKSAAWEIDGIAGATISSRATAQIVGQSAAHWIPRVRSRGTDFVAPDLQE